MQRILSIEPARAAPPDDPHYLHCSLLLEHAAAYFCAKTPRDVHAHGDTVAVPAIGTTVHGLAFVIRPPRQTDEQTEGVAPLPIIPWLFKEWYARERDDILLLYARQGRLVACALAKRAHDEYCGPRIIRGRRRWTEILGEDTVQSELKRYGDAFGFHVSDLTNSSDGSPDSRAPAASDAEAPDDVPSASDGVDSSAVDPTYKPSLFGWQDWPTTDEEDMEVSPTRSRKRTRSVKGKAPVHLEVSYDTRSGIRPLPQKIVRKQTVTIDRHVEFPQEYEVIFGVPMHPSTYVLQRGIQLKRFLRERKEAREAHISIIHWEPYVAAKDRAKQRRPAALAILKDPLNVHVWRAHWVAKIRMLATEKQRADGVASDAVQAAAKAAAEAAIAAATEAAFGLVLPRGFVYRYPEARRLGLYIDTGGTTIRNCKVTVASLRTCPPEPLSSIGQVRTLTYIAAHAGKYDAMAAEFLVRNIPREVWRGRVVHTHDLASFWQIFLVDAARLCYALDTTQPMNYFLKKPCVCDMCKADIDSLERSPCAPIPERDLFLKEYPPGEEPPPGHAVVGKQQYVYPIGHLLLNAMMSILGVLARFLERHGHTDKAIEVERLLPKAFNPNRREMPAEDVDADGEEEEGRIVRRKERSRSRKPPVSARFRDVKTLLKEKNRARLDALIASLPQSLPLLSEDINGTGRWDVQRLMLFSFELARSLRSVENTKKDGRTEDDAPSYWTDMRYFARHAFVALKLMAAAADPFDAAKHLRMPKCDALSDAQRAYYSKAIRFNHARTLVGIPVHYFFEHAPDDMLSYPSPVIRALAREEAPESCFVTLGQSLPGSLQRYTCYKRAAINLVLSIVEAGMVGSAGAIGSARNYRGMAAE